LTYWLWVRGITLIGADVTFLALLSPLVATVLGALLLGEWFSQIQFYGIVLLLASVAAGISLSRRKKKSPSLALMREARPQQASLP
jgi:probable blue pigment (indigoidine) exporter